MDPDAPGDRPRPFGTFRPRDQGPEVPFPDDDHAPGRGLWIAWGLVLVGGLAVLGAVALAVFDPCLRVEEALAAEPCSSATSPVLVVALTGGGTVLAVVGGAIATVLTLRQRSDHGGGCGA